MMPATASPLPWWPARQVATVKNGTWKMTRYPDYALALKESPTFAVSPIDIDGSCHYIGFDVDSGEFDHVKRLLRVLPKEATPLVSWSGMKGWHIWLFPDQPIPCETANAFARRMRDTAGLTCEIFPSSRNNSKCLKWPLSIHPETGVREEFINPDNPGHTYDTRLILECLAGGDFRTPAGVILEFCESGARTSSTSPRNPLSLGTLGTGTLSEAKACTNTLNIQCIGTAFGTLEYWYSREDVGLRLLEKYGRRTRRVGSAFRCILPGHEERKPSASLWRDSKGCIVYHDFHQKDGKEFYTLPEVYAAVVSGEMQELTSYQQACWGWRLLIDLGFVTPPALGAVELPEDMPMEARKAYAGFIRLAEIRRLAGFNGAVQFSKRFAATWCGLTPPIANKATNLLVVLGVLRKHPKGMFTLGEVTKAEINRTWLKLGRPSVARFNKELVARCLGAEVANAVFLR